MVSSFNFGAINRVGAIGPEAIRERDAERAAERQRVVDYIVVKKKVD